MSIKNGLRPVHPGEILRDELDELGMSASALAAGVGRSDRAWITAILRGEHGITADMALRLSRYLGTTPQLWLNLQQSFELRVAELHTGQDIVERVLPREAALVS